MPLFIVACFLVLTLLVGLYFSRKKTTFREYAVGNKDFATATLVATVLATFFEGGGLVRNVECIYDLGLWFIGVLLLVPFGIWIISRLSLRMGPFMAHLSMAETMGSIYGRYPMFITVLVSICNCIIGVTSQIIIMSQAIGMCVTLANSYVIPIFSTLLLIFYSTFGGIRAVTFTDVLQFITFSIIIPLLCWFTFIKIGKPIAAIVPMLECHTKFQLSSLFHSSTQLASVVLLLLADLPTYIIAPALVQRVYMASSPIQAQKVFSCATVFSIIIQVFIVLIGLFTFVGASDLPKAEMWGYIMAHIPPFFKGFVAISLLAMAMSTADSFLNSCAVMVSHDVAKNIKKQKEITDVTQLKIARWTTLVVGILAMLLAFKCQDLLQLLYWSLDSTGPILAAPFILAIFSFRGTARTALIGMVTGGLTILAWNKWVEPSTGINGSFLAMLANGLAMMAAHYLLKQPEDAGWVGPDDQFKQIVQENARKRSEQRESIKSGWTNRKATLAKLMPSHTTMVYVGFYTAITSLLAYFIARITHHGCWLVFQLFVSACFLGYSFLYDISKKIRAIPSWCISLFWLVWLVVYLPRNLIWHWWHLVDPIFTVSLYLAHCTVILWLLPLYLAIGVVAITSLVAIYPIYTGVSFSVLSSLFPLLIASLLVFSMVICLKIKLGRYLTKIIYLETQEKIRAAQQLKASLYDSAMVPTATVGKEKGYGAILAQVIGKIEESISFLDGSTPLYKQDFQSIINKLYDWVAYFNRREKAKKHALLQPATITVDKLMRKVELALSQEVTDPPRLLVEKIGDPNRALSPHIVCDVNQVVYLLVQVVLRVGKLAGSAAPIVSIQLRNTSLQFKQADPIAQDAPLLNLFQATALVVSQVNTAAGELPKVKPLYDDRMDAMGPQGQQEAAPSIDLQQATISSIVAAHYGYLEYGDCQKQPTILLALPNDVTDILRKMTAALPIDCLTSEGPVTPKEQADSMMALMQFHDYVCKSSYNMDPIDVGAISGLLLLLRQHFGFKRHASGQLFYVRAVGIAQLVVEWAFHSPKVIYAALLYELVRHTCLPLSYVKEHYNLGVYAFVLNVISIDKREALDHPSLLYVQNRLKEAIKEDHVQLSVLFIKLAERLYDLRHAAGYIHLTEVHHMVQETLAIDAKIAHTYLDPAIAEALEKAAKQASKICKSAGKDTEKSS